MEPARRDRILLAGLVFGVLFAQVLLYPGVPALVEALGAADPAVASMWFHAAELGAFVVFAYLWGAVSDATGRRKPFIVAGALGGAVGYALLAVLPTMTAPVFEVALLLRALQGAATIGALSLGMTMLMDLPGGHGRNMGAAGIAIGLGTATGAPVGGRLTVVDPLLPLAAAAGVLLLATTLVLRIEDRSPDPDRVGPAAVLRGLVDRPALGLPYIVGFIDRLTAGFFALVGTLYLQSSAFGLDAAETGVVLALFFAPFALLQYPFGVLSDRIGRTIPVVVGSALYGVTVVAIGLAPSIGTVGGLLVVLGVLGALMAPATMALVTDLADPTERGAAMGGFNVAGSIGFLTGILAGGFVAVNVGFLASFAVVGGLEIVVAAAALPLLRHLDVDPRAVFAR